MYCVIDRESLSGTFKTRKEANAHMIARMMTDAECINNVAVLPFAEWAEVRGQYNELCRDRQPAEFRAWLDGALESAGLRESIESNKKGGFEARNIDLYAVRLRPRAAIVQVRDSSKRKSSDWLRQNKTYYLLRNNQQPVVVHSALVRSAINKGKDPITAAEGRIGI